MMDNTLNNNLYALDDPTDSTQGDEGMLYAIPDDDEVAVYDDYADNALAPSGSEEETEHIVVDENYEEEDYEALAASADDGIESDKSPLLLLLNLMFMPVDGWKKLKGARLNPDTFAVKCFFPVTLVAALSEFANFYYDATSSLSAIVVMSLFTFLSFFFGYFTSYLVGISFLPKYLRTALKTDFGKIFILACISTLGIFFALYNLMQMLGPVIVFLPLWTLYLVSRGVRFLRIGKDKESTASVWIGVLLLGAPILWTYIFELLV